LSFNLYTVYLIIEL